MDQKLLSNDPMEQEYGAKITATSLALSRFYADAMNAIVELDEKKSTDHKKDLSELLDNLSIKWATIIVDDISPKQSIFGV